MFSGYTSSTEDKQRLEQLRKEKKDILAVISRIKRQMAEIEIQEEELHREVSKKKSVEQMCTFMSFCCFSD